MTLYLGNAGCLCTSSKTLTLFFAATRRKAGYQKFWELAEVLTRKMKLPIFIADAFTAKAFRGNPAAVCLLENVSSIWSAVPEILDFCRTKYFLKKKKNSPGLFISLIVFFVRWYQQCACLQVNFDQIILWDCLHLNA